MSGLPITDLILSAIGIVQVLVMFILNDIKKDIHQGRKDLLTHVSDHSIHGSGIRR